MAQFQSIRDILKERSPTHVAFAESLDEYERTVLERRDTMHRGNWDDYLLVANSPERVVILTRLKPYEDEHKVDLAQYVA